MKAYFLQVKRKKEVMFITLNRLEKRNALNPELIQQLLETFKMIKRDSSLKAVVLKGRGKGFCSGADLEWLSKEQLFSKREIVKLFNLLEEMAFCPVPLVAQVHGFVIGGGLGLVSVCDVVIGQKGTHFQFTEALVGLVPSVISPFILRKISFSQANFLMLHALPFTAEMAQRVGLLHFVGSVKECDLFLKKVLDQVEKLDRVAVRETKKVLQQVYLKPLYDVKSYVVDVIHRMRQTQSAKNRIKKLLNK